MQQELWLRAKSQVLASVKPVCAMRAASSSHPRPARGSEPLQLRTGSAPRDALLTPSQSPHSPRPAQLRSRVTTNTTAAAVNNVLSQSHNTENADKSSPGDIPWKLNNPVKSSRSHQELHKELLLAHKKGLVVCCKPELQMVLERRKKEQTQREEGEQGRSPLEQVLLQRQQKHLEVMKEKEQEEKIREEIQLLEFIRVRQNLRKVHSVLHKNTNP